MTAALHQLVSTLRLQLRNRMGMIYGYIFPTIFLVAFWVLYRYEPVPIIRHLGELLTVTALGGACFGLPTALVSERERGVWRRYRLAPVSTGSLVTSTVVARYFLLLSAALLQLGLAMVIGMPLPAHPLDLWVAFTFVAFAFLGLGLVIAMLADNVPAVQALGQSIFLPMLIIGGVAVRLDSLPEWAQHLSAFFPGRYAVQALQASATGEGLSQAGFSLLALTLIGAAGCVAAARMFRWDAQERFALRGGKGWIGVALGMWVVVGLLGESTGNVAVARGEAEGVLPPSALGRPGTEADTARRPPLALPPDSLAPDTLAERVDSAAERDTARATPPALAATTRPREVSDGPGERAEPRPDPGAPAAAPDRARAAPGGAEPPWASVTIEDIGRDLRFDRLPPDGGVVTPIAGPHQEPDQFIAEQLECMREWLPRWEPAQVRDPVQRARNILDVAAAADMYQMEAVESLVPRVVFERLQEDFPKDQLVKILYWIAMRPGEGDPPRMDRLSLVCLDAYGSVSMSELRVRTSIYAAKLLGRLIGFIVEE